MQITPTPTPPLTEEPETIDDLTEALDTAEFDTSALNDDEPLPDATNAAPGRKRRRGRVHAGSAPLRTIQVRDVPDWVDEGIKKVADRRGCSRCEVIIDLMKQRVRRGRNNRFF